MTPFIALPIACMPFFCLVFMLTSIAGLYCLSAAVLYRAPIRYIGASAALLLCCLVPTVALTDGCHALYNGIQPSPLIAHLLGVPALLFVLSAVLLPAANIICYMRLSRWRKAHISRMSIKESVDLLPMGLCFCYADNVPRLINLRMNALCHGLTGGALNDAEAFWQTLTGGTLAPGCERVRQEECPIIKMADGTVWMFEKKWITLNGVSVCQLTASDTSEEYRLAEQLRGENRRLNDMKKRLSRYGETVREVTREREILHAKVRIHDELGQVLIASRRVLTVQTPVAELEAVTAQWERSVSVLNNGFPDEKPVDEYALLTDAARMIGITMRWSGEKPREKTAAARILQSMTHECLTNAARHAGSTELYISVMREHGQWTFLCTNNGDAPKAAISEGGGLSGLRSRVEQAGGEMFIAHVPRFALTITIPDEGEAEHWINAK